MSEREAGQPTQRDAAFREGYAHGLGEAKGIPYREAWLASPDDGGAFAQNSRGQWVPSIPLPFYGLRKGCQCGRKFWTADGYQGHYALCHILHLDAP